ncbi:MAG: glycosyltransferase [Phycisphaerae bacterium]|nr:glycosyltransferase [Phycisphaerae bacterium]
MNVTVLITVRNDPQGIATTLSSLAEQTRRPDEIIVVDGGSTDETLRVLRQYEASLTQLRVIHAPGANIARGRNVGAAAARGEIIATTDAGCRAAPNWLAKLTEPLERGDDVEFVAGFYRIDPRGLLEAVAGLATMRGQLESVDPATFNPSARSLALRKSLWIRSGGWPEWIRFSEDTLFDHKVRSLGVRWHFAADAIVHWRPRTGLFSIARQFYRYGTGRGHTQIDAPAFRYNLRNAGAILVAAMLGVVSPWLFLVAVLLVAYFYGWCQHGRAMSIARKLERRAAYPLCLLTMAVVLAANTAGYVVGSWQRWRDRAAYKLRAETYLTPTGLRPAGSKPVSSA